MAAGERAAAPDARNRAAPKVTASVADAATQAPKAIALAEGALAAVDALPTLAVAGGRATPNVVAALPAPLPPDADPFAPRRTSGGAELRRAVLIGLLLATLIVGLALMLRADPAETAPAPVAATGVSVDIASGPVRAPSPVAPPASAGSVPALVQLRLDADLPEAQRDALSAAVAAAGHRAVATLPMPEPIERSRIEFFAPSDRAAAEALARALTPVAGGLIELRDLSAVADGAEGGRIEAWLTGDAPRP